MPMGSLAYVAASVQLVALQTARSNVGRSGWHTAAGGGGFKRRPSTVRFKAFHSVVVGHVLDPG